MTVEAWKKCPVCGKTENQVRAGYNESGSQRCKCKECGKYYTINPKQHTYPEETRKLALKMYYGGISGRSVGKILHMNKSNVMNWIKKASCKENSAPKQTPKIVEMDELYWFLKYKPRTKTRENRDYPEFCVTAKMRCKIELIFQGGSGVGCARLVYNITPTGAEVKGHPRPLELRRRYSAPCPSSQVVNQASDPRSRLPAGHESCSSPAGGRSTFS